MLGLWFRDTNKVRVRVTITVRVWKVVFIGAFLNASSLQLMENQARNLGDRLELTGDNDRLQWLRFCCPEVR